MNRSLFDFKPSEWLPTQDKAVLEYCRNIKREEMDITNENGYTVRVVPHPSSAIACELFDWIYKSDVEDKKTVIVFPNSWKNIYYINDISDTFGGRNRSYNFSRRHDGCHWWKSSNRPL